MGNDLELKYKLYFRFFLSLIAAQDLNPVLR